MAQPLLRQAKMTGTFITAAKLRPVWKSWALVEPSPKKAMGTMSSPCMRAAQAAPTAWVSWVATGELMETKLPGAQDSWQGIWRPLTRSPALPKRLAMKVTSGRPRRKAAPCSR